jgi:GntR family transcriptional regulator / MocR family aminotransferase
MPAMDLLLKLDFNAGRRDGIETALRHAIRDGRLTVRQALPSTRALAAELDVARGTVAAAYEQLAIEGYLHVTPRGTTTVALTAPTVSPRDPAATPAARPCIDFHPGEPSLESFPARAWTAALRTVIATTPASMTGYGQREGADSLRAALADYLGRARGVVAHPDDIVICAGYTHGLQALLRTLRTRGAHQIGMENPGPPHHRIVASSVGLAVQPVAVDEHGADPDTAPGAQALIVTPAHQHPLGIPMSRERRLALIEWARATDGLIIEDDYDGELRYDRQPIGALQGLAPDHVVYAGTTSKSLSPGLRIGWLIVPDWLRPDLLAAIGPHSPVGIFDQLALAELITNHRYERHLRRARASYAGRRRKLLDALHQTIPGCKVQGIAAGVHILLTTPTPADEDRFITAGHRQGIALHGLGPYWHSDRQLPGLLIGFGRPAEHEYASALTALTALLSR